MGSTERFKMREIMTFGIFKFHVADRTFLIQKKSATKY